MTHTLYLVRHTAPDIAPGICYGQLDIGVASSFDEEAKIVRNWLPPADIIVTSPLLRARKLAEYLGQELKCRLRSDVRLMEKSFGAWEGTAWDDIGREEIDAWAADVMNYVPPRGESGQQLMQRAQAALRDIAQLHRETVIIVTHGGMIRAMLAQLGQLPLPSTLPWEVAYGAVIAVRCRPS